MRLGRSNVPIVPGVKRCGKSIEQLLYHNLTAKTRSILEYSICMSLRGKSILIAGATGGLGQAVVTRTRKSRSLINVVHHGDNKRATELWKN